MTAPTIDDLAARVAALEDASAAQREVNRLYGEALGRARARIEALAARVDIVSAPRLDLGPFRGEVDLDAATQLEINRNLIDAQRKIAHALERFNERLDRLETWVRVNRPGRE